MTEFYLDTNLAEAWLVILRHAEAIDRELEKLADEDNIHAGHMDAVIKVTYVNGDQYVAYRDGSVAVVKQVTKPSTDSEEQQ